ncbi:MAG: Gfo/Idh/MocA family oxidoreductase, partial [Pseudomonadota bacterium]|nr:Gfo/Idh/MocA family oxidoreductase [Pseudomonadota bacterium]
MLKLGIVGLGWWGRHIVSTLQNRSEKLRFVYAVDLDVKSIENFASQHDLACLEKFEDLLTRKDVDAIVLATPHSLHEAQIVEAARSGKHVFCEKPLALNREGAKNAIDACEMSGVTLGVGHERRFEPAMKKIKSLIDRGQLGKIMHVESNFSHDKLANLPSNNWRVSKKESPAAGMTATGIHLTDAYLHMFGDIKTVYSQVAKRNIANKNGDVISLQVTFKSGATGSFSSVLETPLYLRYCVFGSRAWVEARDFHHPSEKGPTLFSFCEKEGV